MQNKRITFGDIYQLLEAEGFSPAAKKGEHVRFDNAAKGASLILPKRRPSAVLTWMNLTLVHRTMVDFGLMSEAEFERWVSNPKQFQAA